jgi:hypothetical protein
LGQFGIKNPRALK